MFNTVQKSSTYVYSVVWSKSREKAKRLNPTDEENRSKHYNKVVNSFTISPVNFTMHMMSSCKNLTTNLYWPASISISMENEVEVIRAYDDNNDVFLL